jgi:hypothetical protein
MRSASVSEVDATDLKGSGDLHEELEDDKMTIEKDDIAGQNVSYSPPSSAWDNKDDEDDEIKERSQRDMRLPKVLKAFMRLKENFDSKFKQIWA